MKRYKKYMTPYLSAFIIGPLLMLTEVFGEIMLPKLMSLIINNGLRSGISIISLPLEPSWCSPHP